MKKIFVKTRIFLLGIIFVLISNNALALTTITTKIIAVSSWDQAIFFKIENPTNINPVGCESDVWVGSMYGIPSDPRIKELIEARKTGRTITVIINENKCYPGNQNLRLLGVAF